MMETSERSGDKHIPSRAVRKFPALFRGSAKANNAKASRLWKSRETFLRNQKSTENRGTLLSVTHVTSFGLKCVYMKACAGLGREKSAWVEKLHKNLFGESKSLLKSGLKFNAKFLRHLAVHLVNVSRNEAFHMHFRDLKSNKGINFTALDPSVYESTSNCQSSTNQQIDGFLVLQ